MKRLITLFMLTSLLGVFQAGVFFARANALPHQVMPLGRRGRKMLFPSLKA